MSTGEEKMEWSHPTAQLIELIEDDQIPEQRQLKIALVPCNPLKVSCAAQHENAHVFLATAIVLVTDNFGNKLKGRVILDSGSQINFISKKLVNLLQLPRKNASVSISGIGANQSHASSCLDINVQSRTSDYQVDLLCYVLSNMVTDLAVCIEPNEGWKLPANVLTTLADLEFHKRRSVDLLIGRGAFFEILCAERRIIDKVFFKKPSKKLLPLL